MTREQAINYLFSCGFTQEQVCDVVRALTYESTTKNDLEVDCISRADAIQAMQDKAKKLTNEDTINGLCGAVAILFDLPSVIPQEPRKGHWEHGRELNRVFMGDTLKGINYENWHCSNCHCVVEQSIKPDWNYCPNCGADMREVEE